MDKVNLCDRMNNMCVETSASKCTSDEEFNGQADEFISNKNAYSSTIEYCDPNVGLSIDRYWN